MTDPSSDRAEDRGHRPRGRPRADRNGVRQNATGPEAVGGTVAAENRPGDTGTTGGLGAGNTVASAASSAPTGGGADGSASTSPEANRRAWGALWAMVLGFFMILVDATIVSTAIPAITAGLDTDISGVLWVTSGYLLAYAVPLLITGRLGDRVGPRTVYLWGLGIFTAASLWCGLSQDISGLVLARVVQGLGAALMTPQTMTIITRMFPARSRGAALGIWGATAGVATLVGPLLGGVLVDLAGWRWIFWVNVPVGIFALWRAWTRLPKLPVRSHSFDVPGVLLSGTGLFLVVFGIQEGETYDWGTVVGPITVWLLIGSGLAVLGAFVVWQRFTPAEPLVPLGLFRDRNFSLANIAMAAVSLTVNSMIIPAMLYLQVVRGLNPTVAALSYAPMSLLSAFLAPVVGRALTRVAPRSLALPGMLVMAAGLAVYAFALRPGTPVPLLAALTLVIGLGSAMIWSPVSLTATADLGPEVAGAGSGVFNATRQVAAAIGSAVVAVLMQSRLAANLPAGAGAGELGAASTAGGLPAPLQDAFSLAMTQSLLLPVAVLLLGGLAAAFFHPPHWHTGHVSRRGSGDSSRQGSAHATPQGPGRSVEQG